LRARLKKALGLLRDAGYEVHDGTLINNETQQPLRLEFLLYDTQFERVTLPLIQNLERLGIEASLRVVDVNQFLTRQRNFDFDLILGSFPQSANPGNEQREFWTSDYADAPRSRNLIGLQNPAIDGLVDSLIRADSRQALDTAARALDRVLRWGFYVIPQWHLDGTRVALWDKFGYPQPFPEYTFDLSSWWVDPQRASRIEQRQRGER
jgi:microcin C transport system substrate-binding protein